MKEKKHIDELFKDRFKTFNATPSPEVWDNIQKRLKEEEEDRKVIPLWWKLGGVAAIVAVLLTVGLTFFSPFESTSPITTEEKIPAVIPDINDDVIDNDYINKTEIASEEIKTPSTKETSEADSVRSNPSNKVNNEGNKNENEIQESIALDSKTKKESGSKKSNNDKLNPESSDAVAISTQEEDKLDKKTSKQIDTHIKKDIELEKAEDAIAKNINENTLKDEAITSDLKNNTENESKIEDPLNKRSLIDVINDKNEEVVAVKPSNKPIDKWDIAPNFAPVYYNTITEGSSIDPSFSDNAKSGDINFSYGVQVSYALNNRLRIRSGVSNVDLSYGTSGLELGTAPVSAALKSIDYGGRQIVITAVDKGTLVTQPPGGDPFENITPKSTKGEVELIQNIKYYEIPLELKYAVVDHKIGVHIIGGLSTLFLGNNEVYVKSIDYKETLGEANNLSSVSFSTNVGLGFDYKISKRIKFNIEPMFKYQLNPYTDSSVDFKPYYVGVYSGLSFKF